MPQQPIHYSVLVAEKGSLRVNNTHNPAEFAAGIKQIRDQLASIAQALGIKAAQKAANEITGLPFRGEGAHRAHRSR